MDNLSKYAFVEIISTKTALKVLPALIKYINTLGVPKFF